MCSLGTRRVSPGLHAAPGRQSGRQAHCAEALLVAADAEGTGSLLPPATGRLVAPASTLTLLYHSWWFQFHQEPCCQRKLLCKQTARFWNPSAPAAASACSCLGSTLSETSECPQARQRSASAAAWPVGEAGSGEGLQGEALGFPSRLGLPLPALETSASCTHTWLSCAPPLGSSPQLGDLPPPAVSLESSQTVIFTVQL